MPDLPHHRLRLADLANRKATPFLLELDASGRKAVADALGIVAVRKLRFEGSLAPRGRQDWELRATLGATVVQECVITLAPVTTRIDEDVMRTYLANMPEIEAGEVEMPQDDTAEPLPASIDLTEVMIEALSLAMPPFPRAPGAELGEVRVAEPGVKPMDEDDVKPFAGLGALRDKLAGSGGDDGG